MDNCGDDRVQDGHIGDLESRHDPGDRRLHGLGSQPIGRSLRPKTGRSNPGWITLMTSYVGGLLEKQNEGFSGNG